MSDAPASSRAATYGPGRRAVIVSLWAWLALFVLGIVLPQGAREVVSFLAFLVSPLLAIMGAVYRRHISRRLFRASLSPVALYVLLVVVSIVAVVFFRRG